MKFVLLFSNLVAEAHPGVLRQNPLPHVTAIESIATVVVPAIRDFGPYGHLYVEPSVNCLALSGVLFQFLKPEYVHGLLALGEHAGESITDLQERVVRTIIDIASVVHGPVLLLTSSPAVSVGIVCMARGCRDEATIETEMKSLRVAFGWNAFECVGTKIALL